MLIKLAYADFENWHMWNLKIYADFVVKCLIFFPPEFQIKSHRQFYIVTIPVTVYPPWDIWPYGCYLIIARDYLIIARDYLIIAGDYLIIARVYLIIARDYLIIVRHYPIIARDYLIISFLNM